jgi:hypothetical protein
MWTRFNAGTWNASHFQQVKEKYLCGSNSSSRTPIGGWHTEEMNAFHRDL